MAHFFKDEDLALRRPLRQALFEEYGSADRRIKNIEKVLNFRVDDCQHQVGADKQPLSHVCTIFVYAEDETKITVSLNRNVPMGDLVLLWIAQTGAVYHNDSSWPATQLSFSLQEGEQDKISGLAEAIRAIVAPGKRYSTPSYKHTCPRTADSLDKLRACLDRVWK